MKTMKNHRTFLGSRMHLIGLPVNMVRKVITACLLLTAIQGFAQTPHEVKNYATAYFPSTDNYVMGGTMFNVSTGVNIPNLIFINSGAIVSSRLYNTFTNTDERVVSIKTINNNEVVMISQLIDLSTSNNAGERIVVRKIDLQGNVNSCKVLSSAQLKINLHPMDAAVGINDQFLYICGWVSPYTNGIQPQPTTMTTLRSSFVILYDLVAERFAIGKTFESCRYVLLEADMATRIKILKNGHVFVTGTAKADGTDLGTLLLELDPYSLVPYHAKSITTALGSPVPQEFTMETGFDIAESANGQGYYIFSNLPLSVPNNSPVAPIGQTFAITYVDNNFDVNPSANCRYIWAMTDHLTGINTIDGINPDPSLVNTNVVVSGYQGGGSGLYPISLDQVGVFLSEVNLSTDPSGNIQLNAPFVNVIPTMGTGNYLTDPKSFYNLGGFYSAPLWGPVTTARDLSTGSTDIILNAPIWDVSNNMLTLKPLRTSATGVPIGGCPNEPGNVPNHGSINAYNGPEPIIDNFILIVEDPFPNNSQPFVANYLFDCNPANYRNSSLGLADKLNTTDQIAVSPNPANAEMSISADYLRNNSGNQSIATLTDITGRVLITAEFEKGSTKVKMLVDSIPAGIYLINISQDGEPNRKPIKVQITH